MSESPPLRVFVGYDGREDLAYRVCVHSLLRRASREVEVRPLILSQLRDRGLYRRPADPLAATEFTYTRFLVPHLAGYAGWALFCDCDFLFLGDAASLFALADDRFAVMVVKHDHRPDAATKMDGCVQTVYPRKNWSSLVLWNCGHRANASLTPEAVSMRSGADLHRFTWLDDEEIGALPEAWNWLADASPTTPARPASPEAVHFTSGGPWFAACRDVPFAAAWRAERTSMEQARP